MSCRSCKCWKPARPTWPRHTRVMKSVCGDKTLSSWQFGEMGHGSYSYSLPSWSSFFFAGHVVCCTTFIWNDFSNDENIFRPVLCLHFQEFGLIKEFLEFSGIFRKWWYIPGFLVLVPGIYLFQPTNTVVVFFGSNRWINITLLW